MPINPYGLPMYNNAYSPRRIYTMPENQYGYNSNGYSFSSQSYGNENGSNVNFRLLIIEILRRFRSNQTCNNNNNRNGSGGTSSNTNTKCNNGSTTTSTSTNCNNNSGTTSTNPSSNTGISTSEALRVMSLADGDRSGNNPDPSVTQSQLNALLRTGNLDPTDKQADEFLISNFNAMTQEVAIPNTALQGQMSGKQTLTGAQVQGVAAMDGNSSTLSQYDIQNFG